MTNRDDFTQKTKDILAKRVAYLCSNPTCQISTIGPSSTLQKTVSIGVAAHITAASSKGPRYEQKLTKEQRKSVDNGIWLCQNCSVLIDRGEEKYTYKVLNNWKSRAELFAFKAIGKSKNIELPNFYENTTSKLKKYITSYYSKTKGFSCNIHVNTIHEIFYFKYFPRENEWDTDKSELTWNSSYYFAFITLEKYINQKSNNKQKLILFICKVKSIIAQKGIDGFAEFMFNQENSKTSIPKYLKFVKAFQYYSSLTKNEYSIKTVGSVIYFKTLEKEYIIDSFEGMMEELKGIVKNTSLEEIYTMTDVSIWNEILMDCSIEEERFIPEMKRQLENYWKNPFNQPVNDKDLNLLKEESLQQFLMFSKYYSKRIDIIEFAYQINDSIFYPLAVITMLNILNDEICYEEYCNYHFENEEWEEIYLDDDVYFFIREVK